MSFIHFNGDEAKELTCADNIVRLKTISKEKDYKVRLVRLHNHIPVDTQKKKNQVHKVKGAEF